MKGNGLFGFLCFVAVAGLVVAAIYLLGLWTQTNLMFWLAYLKGVPVFVPYWMALVVTIVTNGLAFAFNVITEIAKLAL
jgi:hypothetical protein